MMFEIFDVWFEIYKWGIFKEPLLIIEIIVESECIYVYR